MDHKIKLTELNKEALEKLEAYMKEKGSAGAEHDETLNSAKDEWQVAWNKLMETLLVLERLEI